MFYQNNTTLWLDLDRDRRARLADEVARQRLWDSLKHQSQRLGSRFSVLRWRKQNQVADSLNAIELATGSMAS